MQDLQSAISGFIKVITSRRSSIHATGVKEELDYDGVVERINASILSTYDERCSFKGSIKATWIFDRSKNKFILNRIRSQQMWNDGKAKAAYHPTQSA